MTTTLSIKHVGKRNKTTIKREFTEKTLAFEFCSLEKSDNNHDRLIQSNS